MPLLKDLAYLRSQHELIIKSIPLDQLTTAKFDNTMLDNYQAVIEGIKNTASYNTKGNRKLWREKVMDPLLDLYKQTIADSKRRDVPDLHLAFTGQRYDAIAAQIRELGEL